MFTPFPYFRDFNLDIAFATFLTLILFLIIRRHLAFVYVFGLASIISGRAEELIPG